MSSGGPSNVNYHLIPLKFHSVHGENIQLSNDGSKATRANSFCKAVAFSNRPISADETICISFAEVQNCWNGVLRLGITNIDPVSFTGGVPKYVCPDMTKEGRCWAKALPERVCVQGKILHFFIRENGEMFYGVDGTLQGLYLSGIDMNFPMWIVVDVYGNTVSVEFVDDLDVPSYRRQPRNSPLRSIPATTPITSTITVPSPPSNVIGVAQSAITPVSTVSIIPDIQSIITSEFTTLAVSHDAPAGTSSSISLAQPATPVRVSAAPTPLRPSTALAPLAVTTAPAPRRPRQCSIFQSVPEQRLQDLQEKVNSSRSQRQLLVGTSQATASASTQSKHYLKTLRHFQGLPLTEVQFHQIYGLNALLNADRTVAMRTDAYPEHAYVFTSRPIHPYEKLIIQVSSVLDQKIGSLAFGVTNCDPVKLVNYQFPHDPEDLCSRNEFWGIKKDVAGQLTVSDELAFYIDSDGDVYYQKNTMQPTFVMSVDKSLMYYMCFDICGSTKCIRLAGLATVESAQPQPQLQPELQQTPRQGGRAQQQQQQQQQEHLQSQPTTSYHDSQCAASSLTVNLPAPPPGKELSTPAQSTTPNQSIGHRSGIVNECGVCMQRPADSAVYPCGHVLMCYDCGKMTWSRQGVCPICRLAIKDIVRLYHSV